MEKVKGLTATSSQIAISGGVAESAPNTFTQNQFDLQLNPLDNEVFVVTAIDVNLTPPDCDVNDAFNSTLASLSTTSRTGLGTLAQSSVMVEARDTIANDKGSGLVGPAFSRMAGETPAADLPYVAIIATNDFFGQVQGQANTNAKGFTFRIWGYRARASSSVYAALVQSEILSS
jgi:hypothetical protein